MLSVLFKCISVTVLASVKVYKYKNVYFKYAHTRLTFIQWSHSCLWLFFFFFSQHFVRMEMMNWYFNLRCYFVMEFDEVENPLQWEHVNTLRRVIEISSIVHSNSFRSKDQGIDFRMSIQCVIKFSKSIIFYVGV